MSDLNPKTKRNYLIFYVNNYVSGGRGNGMTTHLTEVDLLCPNDIYNSALAKVAKQIEREYGYSGVMITNVIFRGYTTNEF
jgi:hypothetical protein